MFSKKMLWSEALQQNRGSHAFGPESVIKREADGTYAVRIWNTEAICNGAPAGEQTNVAYEDLQKTLEYLEIPIRGWTTR